MQHADLIKSKEELEPVSAPLPASASAHLAAAASSGAPTATQAEETPMRQTLDALDAYSSNTPSTADTTSISMIDSVQSSAPAAMRGAGSWAHAEGGALLAASADLAKVRAPIRAAKKRGKGATSGHLADRSSKKPAAAPSALTLSASAPASSSTSSSTAAGVPPARTTIVSLYTDALHSVYYMLTLNELLACGRACKRFYAAISTLRRQERDLVCNEWQLQLFLVSPLRRHVSMLSLHNCFDLTTIVSIGAAMPHLRAATSSGCYSYQPSCHVYLDRAEFDAHPPASLFSSMLLKLQITVIMTSNGIEAATDTRAADAQRMAKVTALLGALEGLTDLHLAFDLHLWENLLLRTSLSVFSPLCHLQKLQVLRFDAPLPADAGECAEAISLLRALPHLTSLDISEHVWTLDQLHLYTADAAECASNHEQLTLFSLQCTPLTAAMAALLPRLRQLQTLEFQFGSDDDAECAEVIRTLRSLPMLTKLTNSWGQQWTVEDLRAYTDEAAEGASNHRRLVEFGLGDTDLTPEVTQLLPRFCSLVKICCLIANTVDVSFLLQLPHLEDVTINFYAAAAFTTANSLTTLVSTLCAMCPLQRLYLSHKQMSDADLTRILERHSQLEQLHLDGMPEVRSLAWLDYISPHALNMLDLYRCGRVLPSELHRLDRFAQLRELYVDYCFQPPIDAAAAMAYSTSSSSFLRSRFPHMIVSGINE
jgi:hypothetical protein